MTKREFPSRPLVGVGAVIIHPVRRGGARVLLARRGRAPALGEWSIPGGLVKVGEPLKDAVAREVLEETGLRVRVGEMIELLDRIIYEEEPKPAGQRKLRKQSKTTGGTATGAPEAEPDAAPAPRVQYHYVIIDYLCRLAPRCRPQAARPGTDVTELRWATRREAAALHLRPALRRVLRKAFAA